MELVERALLELGVEAFVPHSSLAFDERRRAENTFAEGRNCVIVATSALELGIDIGALDHLVQVGALPRWPPSSSAWGAPDGDRGRART